MNQFLAVAAKFQSNSGFLQRCDRVAEVLLRARVGGPYASATLYAKQRRGHARSGQADDQHTLVSKFDRH